MIDGVEFMRVVLEEHVTAFSIRVVAEQVEEHDRFEELPVILGEAEVVIFGIIFDELLKRTRAVWAVLTQRGKRNNMKAKRLTHEIRGDFASCKSVLGKIPEWLLAAQGFVNSGIFPAFLLDGNQECVI